MNKPMVTIGFQMGSQKPEFINPAAAGENAARRDNLMRHVTVEKQAMRKGSTEATYLVKLNGHVIGLLTKFRNTKYEQHPFKAYLGFGASIKLIGFFYDGKQAAINAILAAR